MGLECGRSDESVYFLRGRGSMNPVVFFQFICSFILTPNIRVHVLANIKVQPHFSRALVAGNATSQIVIHNNSFSLQNVLLNSIVILGLEKNWVIHIHPSFSI